MTSLIVVIVVVCWVAYSFGIPAVVVLLYAIGLIGASILASRADRRR